LYRYHVAAYMTCTAIYLNTLGILNMNTILPLVRLAPHFVQIGCPHTSIPTHKYDIKICPILPKEYGVLCIFIHHCCYFCYLNWSHHYCSKLSLCMLLEIAFWKCWMPNGISFQVWYTPSHNCWICFIVLLGVHLVSPDAIHWVHSCLSAVLNSQFLSNGCNIYTFLLVITIWLVLLIFNMLLTSVV
jgi:hypothetical protein